MEKEIKYNLDLSRDSRWNWVSATQNSKSALLYLQEAGDFIAGPDYFTTRMGFDSFLIKLTVSGEGILEYEGNKYIIQPGMFYWIDCTKLQDYRTNPDVGQWHVLWIHFNGPVARYYYETFMTKNNNKPAGTLAFGSDAYNLMQSLLDISTKPDDQQAMDFQAASLITQLLTECILSVANITGTESIPNNVLNVQIYLENNYKDRITLDELGSIASTNPCYLQKQFKKYLGQSPTDYLIYLRINKAKKLLRTTHMSIGEIASEVGIDNHNYFARLFKAQENMTPNEYRRIWPTIEKKPEEQSSFYLDNLNR